jgi:DNA-directed RNA polymerase subunit E'/Rpb7
MMDELFISTKIKSSLSVEPKDLNNNLNKKIIKKIKNDIEGKCIKNGYVKNNSVKLLKRSLGETLTSQFNGAVLFHIEYLVELCNPLEGANINCIVLNINKMGVLGGMIGEDNSPLNILLARQHHINNPEFEDLKENDIINIKVLGKRYEYGDSQISIIGLLESEYIKQNNTPSEEGEFDKSNNVVIEESIDNDVLN